MSILRIEVKVDGKLEEVFEFDSTVARDPISAFWRFIREVQRVVNGWSFSRFFRSNQQD